MAPEGSILVVEEYFASGDPRFRSELLYLIAPKKLVKQLDGEPAPKASRKKPAKKKKKR